MRQLLLDLGPPPAPSLDNFVAEGNAEVVNALRCWLSGTLAERCIYLWGPPASGKTHLLTAMVADRQTQGHAAVLIPAEALSMDQAADAAWLAVDDVQRLSPAGQAVLFTLLNRAAQGDALLALSGTVAPAGLTLREDVRTRVGAGLVLQLRPLSDEDKARALRAHAASRGFDLPSDAAAYLLRHARRDLRWLMTVLDALDRYSLQTRRPITLPLLREVLAVHQDR